MDGMFGPVEPCGPIMYPAPADTEEEAAVVPLSSGLQLMVEVVLLKIVVRMEDEATTCVEPTPTEVVATVKPEV